MEILKGAKVLLMYYFTLTLAQYNVEFQFSHVALLMPESLGRRSIRQNWMIVPHLYENEEIRVSFCLNQSTIIEVKNITYSNDGARKTISIEQDSVELGRFHTHSDSDWGRLWDKPFKSGFIGQSRMLKPGKHELKLKVVKSYDCYGFEPWSMQVTLFIPFDTTKLWCGSEYLLVPKDASCRNSQSKVDITTTSTTPPTTTTLPPTFVNVKQLSYNTKCLDKKNVKIQFTTQNIDGTSILIRQNDWQSTAKQSQNEKNAMEGKMCDSDIWQLGNIDSDNREFSPLYPGKSLTIDISDLPNQEKKFPMKILPFATTDIIINFDIPSNLKIEHGSAYFALGLVNLTKPADIGLRYYDDTVNDFSEMHVITFTPEYQVMGWNVPNLGTMHNRSATIHLHFQSEANVIMFDFLKVQYTKRDERKINTLIARKGHWKIRGLRFDSSVGMKVIVNDTNKSSYVEDAVLMYQVSAFSRYQTVLRIKKDGTFYPYKSFRIKIDESQRTFVDTTGFAFNMNVNTSSRSHSAWIRSLHIDTSTNVITSVYEDGSVLRLRLVATSIDTKLQIVSYAGNAVQKKINDAQNIVFTSTYVSDYFAAVNTLTTKGRSRNVLSKLGDFSGEYTYTFKKTSPTTLFYANNFIQLQFPRSS